MLANLVKVKQQQILHWQQQKFIWKLSAKVEEKKSWQKKIETRRKCKWVSSGRGSVGCGAWHIDVDIIVIQVSFKCATWQHFLTSANWFQQMRPHSSLPPSLLPLALLCAPFAHWFLCFFYAINTASAGSRSGERERRGGEWERDAAS